MVDLAPIAQLISKELMLVVAAAAATIWALINRVTPIVEDDGRLLLISVLGTPLMAGLYGFAFGQNFMAAAIFGLGAGMLMMPPNRSRTTRAPVRQVKVLSEETTKVIEQSQEP